MIQGRSPTHSSHSCSSSEPPNYGTFAWKQCRTKSLCWSRPSRAKRYLVLSAGRLYWHYYAFLPEDAEELANGHEACSNIDFSKTTCEVSVVEDHPTHISLRPIPGKRWSQGDQHSSRGTAREFIFEFDKESEAEAWLEHMREHVKIGSFGGCRAFAIASAMHHHTACLEDGGDCPICLESLSQCSSEEVVSTVCGHNFHASCCHDWLMKATSCPVCRCELFADPNRKKKVRNIPPVAGAAYASIWNRL